MKFMKPSCVKHDVSLEHLSDRVQMAATLPFYYEVACAIDKIVDSIPTQEALNSNFLGRFFVSIADTFTGLLNTFKTNTFKFNHALKRSELREYVESNRMKVSIVEGIAYDKVKDIPMDVPAHLKTEFKTAIDTIGEVYIKLNTLNRAKLTESTLIDIFKSITANNNDYIRTIRTFATNISAAMTEVRPLVLKCQKEFSEATVGKKAYKLVYADTKAFVDCKSVLLDLEFRLQEIREIRDTITRIEAQLKGICNTIEEDTVQVDSPTLYKFGEALKSLALLFDSTQLASTRQVTLEHNTVLNYNTLYTKAR